MAFGEVDFGVRWFHVQESISLLQHISRNHPLSGNDVRPVPAFTPYVEDFLHERGIDICHESVRLWWNRFGPVLASEIRKNRSQNMRQHIQWRWHLDEVYVRINGKQHYLWRAVDHEGEVSESYVTKRRDRKTVLRFLKKARKRYGTPKVIVTDRLASYRAVMKVIGNEDRQETERWANNRAENSHQPFRRRERAMLRFRQMRSLQKFASVD